MEQGEGNKRGNLEKELPVSKKRYRKSSYKILPTQIRGENNIYIYFFFVSVTLS